MANIKQRKIPLKRWYNSHTDQAQKRLDSTLAPFRDRIDNSLRVNSVRAIIYRRVKIGKVCSCSGFTDEDEFDDNGGGRQAAAEFGASSGLGEIQIEDVGSGAFGGKSNTIGLDMQKPRVVQLDSLLPTDSSDESLLTDFADHMSTNAFGQTTMCGICYMQGLVPSYQPVGFTTYILTHLHVKEIDGYTLNRGDHPYSLEKISEEGSISYTFTVPKYYKTLQFSIRNNVDLQPKQVLWFNGKRLTKAVLDLYRGKDITVQVHAPKFTHVVLMFDLGAEPIFADMSEESNTLNYDQELTVSNLNLVFSQKVGQVSSQDIILIPERNYVLKITDAPRKRTSKMQMWEWSVSTRTVQRIEPLYNIHRGQYLR